ncbi:MAG: hypothetical protein D6711_18710 [Chloroflexi bacterium]|nr:MAG: hypothetical protein D6711_18710 [Chloroflexota bacterium]
MTTAVSRNGSSLLKKALRANGIFCTASGLIIALAASPLAAFLGDIPQLALIIVGIGLIPYGMFLLWATQPEAVSRNIGVFAVTGDLLWVIGSAIILLAGWPALTVAGKWTVGLIAEVVAAFAAVQIYALWRQ